MMSSNTDRNFSNIYVLMRLERQLLNKLLSIPR